MTTSIITDLTRSARAYKTDAVYATARNAVSADALNQSIIYIGQDLAGNYTIYRGMLLFDTSAIPVDAIIFLAKIRLYALADWFPPAENLLVVTNGQPARPSDPVVVGDFDRTFYSGDGGSMELTLTSGQYVDITLNATGRSWINKGGITKFCLRTTFEIDGDAPPTVQKASFEGPTHAGGHDPKLILGYLAGGLYNTIQCLPVSDCILNTNADYATCRDSATGTLENDTLSMVGQSRYGDYGIYRSYLYFDTRNIQIGANIKAASLVLYGANTNLSAPFNIVVQSGQPSRPTYPTLVAGDFDRTFYSGNYGQLADTSFVENGENIIDLSVAFIEDQLMVSSITKICLRSSRDINGDVPSIMDPGENISFFSPREPDTTKIPRLEITFAGGRVAEAPALVDISWAAAQRGF